MNIMYYYVYIIEFLTDRKYVSDNISLAQNKFIWNYKG